MNKWLNTVKEAQDGKESAADDAKKDKELKNVLRSSAISKNLQKKGEEAKKQAQLRRVQLIQDGLQAGIPRFSIKPLLKKAGLEKYYDYFERSGYDVMESYVRRENHEIDSMLTTIELSNGIEFPVHHRIQLWKTFRYKWFKSPAAVKKFILPNEVPDIFLPKPYYRQNDSNVDLAQLDPDRVRQVTRKEAPPWETPTDVEGLRIEQFENYNRLGDEVYEMRDIQRSVQEWQTLDPQKMLRADPREEVFFVRIRKMEMFIANKMTQQRQSDKKHEGLKRMLNLLRLACGIMAFIMIFYSFNSNQGSTHGDLLLQFVVSSKSFISGVWFFVGSCFAHGIMGHWHQVPELQRLQRMHMLCKKLSAQLVDFRLESADMRLEKFDIPVDEMKDYFGLQTEDIDYEAAEARSKGKMDFATWMKKANPTGRKIDLSQIAEALDDTYEQLPALPHGFQRQGGDRLAKMRGKIGGAAEFMRTANPNVAAHMQQLNYNAEAEQEQMRYIEKQKARIQRRLQRRMQKGEDVSSSEESSDDSSDTSNSDDTPEQALAIKGASSSSSSGHMQPGPIEPQQAGSSSSGAPPSSGIPPLGPLGPREAGSTSSSSAAPPHLPATAGPSSGSIDEAQLPPMPQPARWADAAPGAPRPSPAPNTGAAIPESGARPPSSESQRAAMAAASVPPGTSTGDSPQPTAGQLESGSLPGTPENPPGMGDLPPVPPGVTARSQDSTGDNIDRGAGSGLEPPT